MLYLTKESAQALGEAVSTIARACGSGSVELQVDMDHLVAKIGIGKPVSKEKPEAQASEPKKRKYHRYNAAYECDGESHTIKEWAKKLGVPYSCVKNRIERTGNPYGRKGPSDTDKAIASGIAGKEAAE